MKIASENRKGFGESSCEHSDKKLSWAEFENIAAIFALCQNLAIVIAETSRHLVHSGEEERMLNMMGRSKESAKQRVFAMPLRLLSVPNNYIATCLFLTINSGAVT